jgi:hypothetical protein
MEDETTPFPLRKPARLLVYPFIEIQDFEEETIEQTENEDELKW